MGIAATLLTVALVVIVEEFIRDALNTSQDLVDTSQADRGDAGGTRGSPLSARVPAATARRCD